jgi:hypothetical protein
MERKERNLMVVKYGAYTCGILFLFAFLLPMIGAGMGLVQNILLVILGAEIFLCCQEYKRKSDLPLSFKEAFAMGWQVSFIAGLINAILVASMVLLVGREELMKNIAPYKSLLMTQGKLDEIQTDQVLQMITNPWFLLLATILFYLVSGLFLSILVAYFVKSPSSSASNEKQF